MANIWEIFLRISLPIFPRKNCNDIFPRMGISLLFFPRKVRSDILTKNISIFVILLIGNIKWYFPKWISKVIFSSPSNRRISKVILPYNKPIVKIHRILSCKWPMKYVLCAPTNKINKYQGERTIPLCGISEVILIASLWDVQAHR